MPIQTHSVWGGFVTTGAERVHRSLSFRTKPSRQPQPSPLPQSPDRPLPRTSRWFGGFTLERLHSLTIGVAASGYSATAVSVFGWRAYGHSRIVGDRLAAPTPGIAFFTHLTRA